MNVLLCGASGFLGRAIEQRLLLGGHSVVRGVRRPGTDDEIAVDYRCDTDALCWMPRLAGVDAVVNAVGILREQRPGDFDLIHERTPAALFQACARSGIRRVVQISALGCCNPPHYLRSKHAADNALQRILPGKATVLRPGLVFGAEGASTRFFLTLAALPVLGIPCGAGKVQPVHIDDVAETVVMLLEKPGMVEPVLPLPGPRQLTFPQLLMLYRRGMGLVSPLSLPVPAVWMTLLARLAGCFRRSLLCPVTWRMLREGNIADPAAACGVLGRPLRDPGTFITVAMAGPLRARALASWRGPLLRGALAAIWAGTAILSAGVFPLRDSMALLAPYGLSGISAAIALSGGVLLDLLMGILTLWRPGRRLWLFQLLVVIVYSALVAWRLPEYLFHPFGPILKNLAIVALLLVLLGEEKES